MSDEPRVRDQLDEIFDALGDAETGVEPGRDWISDVRYLVDTLIDRDDDIALLRDQLASSRQAVEALRGERDAYAIVVAACLRDSRIREIGDWDGGAIQDTLTKAGILAETPVTESCGEDCRCVEYDFPATCYRVTPLGFKAYEYADRALSRPEEGP